MTLWHEGKPQRVPKPGPEPQESFLEEGTPGRGQKEEVLPQLVDQDLVRMKTQQMPFGESLPFIQYLLGTPVLGSAGPSRSMDAGLFGGEEA